MSGNLRGDVLMRMPVATSKIALLTACLATLAACGG